uniref:PX domain-containing protein n=1 Tax=Steinernema glaseri TaxID=37863 RepID=A0A1I8ANH1_9BILA
MVRSDFISVRCVVVEDKRQVAYNISVDGGAPMQKMFVDFEKLYDKIKQLLPPNISGPPKKKFFNLDGKLPEKRRAWIETITSLLLRTHPYNEYVQNFYAALRADQNEVYLGPSERKRYVRIEAVPTEI